VLLSGLGLFLILKMVVAGCLVLFWFWFCFCLVALITRHIDSILKAVRASVIKKNYIDDKRRVFVSVQPFKFQWLLYVLSGLTTKILRSAHTVYLCVSYGSEKEQRFFKFCFL